MSGLLLTVGETYSSPTSITTTTTTETCWSRIRGLSIDILKLLLEDIYTSSMIAEMLGYEGNYVRPYLYNLKRYGLTIYVNGFWTINPSKKEIVETIINIKSKNNINNIYNISKRRVKEEKKKSKSRVKENGKIAYSNIKEKTEQIARKYSLSESEIVVVEVLLDWYSKYGSKFIVVNSMDSWSKYGLTPPSTDTVTSLISKNVIYVFRDKTIGVKIGLKNHVFNLLEGGKHAVSSRRMA